MDETAKKPQPGGFKKITPEHGVDTRFTPDNQPPREDKSKGWAKKRALKTLLQIVTDKKFNSIQKSEWHKLASEYFGIPVERVTVELMMDFRQIEKAINSGNTQSYVAVKDRVYGKPVQALDIDANLNINDATVVIGKKQVSKE